MTKIRLGSRASRLALIQSEKVKRALMAAHGLASNDIDIIKITTSGDRFSNTPLHDIGGKALFAKELEIALLEGAIDIAMHSTKDLPAVLPKGMILAATLERDDVRDVWLSPYPDFHSLPKGATVGTSSPRRAAYIKTARPDVHVVPFRGNLPTRIEKLEKGDVDGTFLALAGIERLGITTELAHILPTDSFMPAAAQGAIGVECLDNNSDMRTLLSAINHAETFHSITAERAFQEGIDGSCTTPLAAYATIKDNMISLKAAYLTEDTSPHFVTEQNGPMSDARAIGLNAAEDVKKQMRAQMFTL